MAPLPRRASADNEDISFTRLSKQNIACVIIFSVKYCCNPDDYVMITYWEDENFLAAFAGES